MTETISRPPDIIAVRRDLYDRLMLIGANGNHYMLEARRDAFLRGERIELRSIPTGTSRRRNLVSHPQGYEAERTAA